ncbi:Gliding motility-associated-like protein [Tenacibaculum sp. 190524A05c]|uniref:T9SS type B sorting domain-containing protein n=1 Tax=Tenacibaculum platacis TaxID=3137852 RepID=UPI0031FACE7B
MKKITGIISFFFISIVYSQSMTFVPDDNFEQVLIDQGFDTPPLDDFVPTDNIKDVDELFILNFNISDLTGIEDFRALEHLQINNNNLTELDVSSLTKLQTLACENNKLTKLDITWNTRLENLFIDNNEIEVLDTTNNPLLEFITINNNKIQSLDLSGSEFLKLVELDNNKLNFVDLRNENNTNIETITIRNNPNLTCIFVDDVSYSNTNWTNKDATSFYVETERECYNLTCGTEIDTLEDVEICEPYVLPSLTHGNYYTLSGGLGNQLFPGDLISETQVIFIYNIDPDDENCFRETSFKVTICTVTINQTFPSFFTPNQDGINDFWRVSSDLPIQSIHIFDRFGSLLVTIPKDEGWDGLSNGRKMPSNTYWYKVIFEDNTSKVGSFSLLRK